MIEVVVSSNPFDSSERQVFQLERAVGSCVADFIPDDLLEAEVSFYLDGERVSGCEPVPDGAKVGIVVRPGFETLVGKALIQVLVAAAVSYTFSLLFGRPANPSQNEETSPTYSWTGSRQNSSAGSPIAITAGRMRIGGTVIGEYVDAQATPARNILYQLVALGEGPLSAIAGRTTQTSNGAPISTQDDALLGRRIFLDDERSGNIRGVSVHVRMGTSEQDAIEWFDKVRIEHEVGRTLSAPETDDDDNDTIYFDTGHWYDGGNADLWDQYGVSFTLENEADSLTIRARYPRGLYTSDGTTGEIRSSWTGLQVRYRELDAIGNQIASGGMNGDGWVYTPPVLPFSVSHRDVFEYDHHLTLFDKDTYTPPPAGDSLNTTVGPNANGNVQLAGGSPIVIGDPATAFCCSTWIKFNSLSGSVGDMLHIMGDLDESNQEGWSVCALKVTPTFGSDFWTLRIRYGTGSSVQNVDSAATWLTESHSLQTGEWFHVALSYEPGEHFRCYLNGYRLVNAGSISTLKWGGNVHFGRNPQGAGTTLVTWDGRVDDFLLWEGSTDGDIVNEQYALGLGRYGTGYVDALRCWINWETPGLTQKATTTWFGDGTLSNGAFIGSGDGKISTDPDLSGTPKRGRYHVEVVRINEKSTNPLTSDLAELASITTVLDESLPYAGTPLMALRVEATDQLQGTMPPTSVIADGYKWPVWDGQSTSNPSISSLYTANPAWICYGILTNKAIGLGRYFTLDDVDLPELKAWADFCDEILPDGSYALEFSGTEILNDILFHSLEPDPVTAVVRGALEIILPKTVHGELPSSWQPDGWILLENLPTPTTNPGQVTVDPNGGYRIYKIEDNGTSWSVWAWWDRTNEGDAWASGDLLGADVLGGILGNIFTASQVRGGIPRFEFHGSFDTHGNAWEALVKVAEVGRAVPIPSGNKVRFRYSAPTQAQALITRGSIIPGTFEMSIGGSTDDTNAYDFTIADRLRSFERTADEVFDETITDPEDATQVVKRSTDLFGVTHPDQARRQLQFDLRARRLLKRRGRLEMPVDGLPLQPGDVVRLSHDVLPRGVSGRLMAGSTTSSVRLDQRITFETGKTYEIVIRRTGLGFLTGSVDVTALGGPGEYDHDTPIPITGISESFTAASPYIVTESGTELVVEVGSTTFTQDLRRAIEFVEYDESVFTDL